MKDILEYFRGLMVDNGHYIVKVAFKPKWSVFNDESEVIGIAQPDDCGPDEYVYFAETDKVDSVDDIYELIRQTIQINIEAEQKMEFLRKSMTDLQNVFKTHSYKEVLTLKFSIDGKVLKPEDYTPKEPVKEPEAKEKESEPEVTEEKVEVPDETAKAKAPAKKPVVPKLKKKKQPAGPAMTAEDVDNLTL